MRVPRSSLDQTITMTTPLDRSIKRELELDGTRYTVTISPEGIKVTEKGKRKGQEITWRDIISGDAALRRDLSLSVEALRLRSVASVAILGATGLVGTECVRPFAVPRVRPRVVVVARRPVPKLAEPRHMSRLVSSTTSHSRPRPNICASRTSCAR